jgi:hypothetical protein
MFKQFWTVMLLSLKLMTLVMHKYHKEGLKGLQNILRIYVKLYDGDPCVVQ